MTVPDGVERAVGSRCDAPRATATSATTAKSVTSATSAARRAKEAPVSIAHPVPNAGSVLRPRAASRRGAAGRDGGRP